MSEQLIAVLVLATALVAAAALFRRAADPTAPRTLEGVSHHLGQIQAELGRVSRAQEELRHEVQRGREASLRELAQAAQGLRGEIGAAQRALAEVKALEEGRAQQMSRASESLRRLEAVVAGSGSRGAAGENILARALQQLPPDLLEVNVSFGSRVVEYALRLPGGRYLPVDSKWTSLPALERLAECTDPLERRRLTEQVARELRGRAREMVKYLDPERTLSLGLLAVPDAVYEAAPEVHAESYREGVLIVPYSLALPYVLALYRLTVRFGTAPESERLALRLRSLGESLRRLEEEVEGRLSRGLVQVANARDALRNQLAEARETSERLLRSADGEHAGLGAMPTAEAD